MPKENKAQTIARSYLKPIDLHRDLQIKMMESIRRSSLLLGNCQFNEAAASLSKFHNLADLLEKQIRMHMTQTILDFYGTDAKLSYSIEEVQRQKDEVFKWLGEVKSLAKQLLDLLRVHKKDPKQIWDTFNILVKKNTSDLPLGDFLNTLTFIVAEFALFQAEESTGRLTSIFDSLELHPIVKNASRKLFNNGHYSQAILEAFKAVNKYVQKKSKRRDLDGVKLMSEAFSFTHDKTTRETTRKPILQINPLRELSDYDEQHGFMFLFMGSMRGIRNPKAHDLIDQRDPFRTLQYLSLASLLSKRVDEAKLNS